MSSVRIDLNNGSCLRNNAIDRSKPAIIDEYMSNTDWEKFCDDIDEAMKPWNSLRIIMMIFFALVILSIVLTPIIFFIWVSTFNSESVATIFIVPASLAVIMFSVFFVVVCCGCVKHSKATAQIQEVLAVASQKQPRLSFHLRSERYYRHGGLHHHHTGIHHHHTDVHQHHTDVHHQHTDIHHHHHVRSTATYSKQYLEVSIKQMQSTIPIGSPDPVATFSAQPIHNPVVVSSAPSSAAGRLEELEKVKHLLSPQEYDAKRAEILNKL